MVVIPDVVVVDDRLVVAKDGRFSMMEMSDMVDGCGGCRWQTW